MATFRELQVGVNDISGTPDNAFDVTAEQQLSAAFQSHGEITLATLRSSLVSQRVQTAHCIEGSYLLRFSGPEIEV
jgi:hypothetical protein